MTLNHDRNHEFKREREKNTDASLLACIVSSTTSNSNPIPQEKMANKNESETRARRGVFSESRKVRKQGEVR